MLVDAAIPGDRNVVKKEAEKILKYKDLIIEVQCMWNVKAKVITSNTLLRIKPISPQLRK
jgi:hypothetical protein